jgi:pimeloyl-ACP methyl ester carboxylesterase
MPPTSPAPELAPELATAVAGRTDPGAPTLVLLHGLGDSGACWPDAVRRWSTSYAVVTVDALGHGTSPRFTPEQLAAPDPMEQMYAAAETVVARVAAERGPVGVVGHSMGGGLAGALAARRPDLVTAVVLEEPAWRDPQLRVQPREVVEQRIAECRSWASDPEAEMARGRAENPTWPEAEFEPWGRAKAEVDIDFLELGVASLLQPWDEVVAAVRVPALAVTGDGTVLLSPEILRRAADLHNPHLRLEVVAGAGHCVRRDRADAFHTVVDPWLAEHLR